MSADRVWNRAALENGGRKPGPGDRALAALLLFHGLAMNGGVHHAFEGLGAADRLAATEGYAYFGLEALADFLRAMADDPLLSESESGANRRYAELVPDDSHLLSRFEAE